MTQAGARIHLLEKNEVGPETAAIYDVLLAQRGVVPNMFKALAYAPGIAQGVAGFLKALLGDGALKGSYKELVAVRVSILNDSEYAVKAHSISASKKGASHEQIAAVREFESGPYSAKEKLGFRVADRLHRGGPHLDDALFAEVQREFGEAEIVELFLTASAFEMFPRFIDGLRIPVTAMPAGK